MSDEQTIFLEAVTKQSQDRSAYLDQVCAADSDLRKRVEILLEAHDRAGRFLETPPLTITTHAEASLERSGTIIGKYKLLEQIGEGGMGAVFMAEQLHPVQRRVALKIIKPGLDSRQVIARFEAERQALAMMDHPNIAKVFDAGATDAGRPYFVMELVRGIPITEYCDQHKLAPRQRLELFIPVCQAVQHAHQKGIIHRDLKPNNVLITLQDGDKPTPKVIDFGIAKATAGQRLTDLTLFTEFRQLIGTPLYMSPEQAEMSAVLDVDTRSDVYSLGVLLYELLTGTTPFEKQRLATAAFEEVRRIIREEEPPRPSTRLSTLGVTLATVSAQRQTDPKKLSQTMRGELDWIVMKALEKDRARRYETAIGFAHDVERYLADQPVEACPPSRSYRFKKFVRRNKPVITTVAALVLVLALATVVSTWQAVRATRAEHQVKLERDQAVLEKKRADEQKRIATSVQDFLNEDLLQQADPWERATTTDVNLTVRDALDRAAAQIGSRFKDQPLLEAAIQFTIGRAYLSLEPKKAKEHLSASWEIRRNSLGSETPETLESASLLAYNYALLGQAEKGKAILTPIIERQEQRLGKHDKGLLPTLRALGGIHFQNDEYAKAELVFRRILDLAEEVHESPSFIRSVKQGLAVVLGTMRKLKEAEPLLLADVENCRKTLGEGHLNTAAAEANLAANYRAQKRFDAAVPLMLQAMKTYRAVLGDQDSTTVGAIYTLGWIYRNANQHEQADRYLNEALELSRKKFGESEPTLLNDIAYANLQDGNYARAEELYLRVIKGWRVKLGDDNPDIVRAVARLGLVTRKLGKTKESDEWLEQALVLARKAKDEPGSFMAIETVARVMLDVKRYAEAEECFLRDLKILEASRGENHPDVAECCAKLAALAWAQRQYPQAEQWCRRALSIRARLDVPDWKGAGAQTILADLLIEQGKLEEAERTLTLAYTQLRPLPSGVIESSTIERAFVRLYDRWQKPEKAAVWKAKLSTSRPTTAATRSIRVENP